MTLNIKSDEVDRLARELTLITGESVTDAVANALRERLEREKAARQSDASVAARIKAFSERVRAEYISGPVTRAEWDRACGDRSAL